MKTCVRCVLPENFPGARFDERGLCSYCRSARDEAKRQESRRAVREKFESLLAKVKGRHAYDALMCFSGGKDSAYTLALLKERYGLNILAFTLDNGFVASRTEDNIKLVVETLGVDHVFFKPRFDLLRAIFRGCAVQDVFPRKTQERASPICTACMGIVKFSALRFCLDLEIPFVAFGWSPGQAPVASSLFKNTPEMIRETQKALLGPLVRVAGDGVRDFFLEERHWSRPAEFFPYSVHPLAFLDYDEKEIFARVARLGWEAPTDTDRHSTNCLLNTLAVRTHRDRYGFHPYVFEVAGLVRTGVLSRDEGLARFTVPENTETLERVREKLGIPDSG